MRRRLAAIAFAAVCATLAGENCGLALEVAATQVGPQHGLL